MLDVGSRNEANNYDGIKQANEGQAFSNLQQMNKDITAGKAPKTGGGGDEFNILTDMAQAKAGGPAAGIAADLAGGASSGSTPLSGGRPRNKRQAAIMSKFSNYNTLTGEAGYSKKKENAAAYSKFLSTGKLKGAGVFMSSGVDSFTGEKMELPRLIGKEEFFRNLDKYDKKTKDRLDTASYNQNHQLTSEVVAKESMGWQEGQTMIRQQSAEAVLSLSQGMSPERQDVLAKQVLPEPEVAKLKEQKHEHEPDPTEGMGPASKKEYLRQMEMQQRQTEEAAVFHAQAQMPRPQMQQQFSQPQV